MMAEKRWNEQQDLKQSVIEINVDMIDNTMARRWDMSLDR